jgi:hypothetical protein
MPFDPEIPLRDTPTVHPRWREIEIAREMERLLAERENWCQGALELKGPDGRVSNCLLGALNRVSAGHAFGDRNESCAGRSVDKALRDALPPWSHGSLVHFNNESDHSDVVALLARVRQSLEMESA